MFTKFDLCGAYNPVRIAEGDKWKTQFRTSFSSYESPVMHYGLTNALASFQRFMSNTFEDLLDVYILIYLGDVLILS